MQARQLDRGILWIHSMNVHGQYIIFHKFDNFAVILNILASFSRTHTEMYAYLHCYVCTHHKDFRKKTARWHPAQSEAGVSGQYLNPNQTKLAFCKDIRFINMFTWSSTTRFTCIT